MTIAYMMFSLVMVLDFCEASHWPGIKWSALSSKENRSLVLQAHYLGGSNGLVHVGMGRGEKRLVKAARIFLHAALASTTLFWMAAEGTEGSAGSVPCLLVTGLWGQAMMVPGQKTTCSLKSERESHQQSKHSLTFLGGSEL